MLYTADELTAMGVVAGMPIQEIRLESMGFSYGMTTLRYQLTDESEISEPILRGGLICTITILTSHLKPVWPF